MSLSLCSSPCHIVPSSTSFVRIREGRRTTGRLVALKEIGTCRAFHTWFSNQTMSLSLGDSPCHIVPSSISLVRIGEGRRTTGRTLVAHLAHVVRKSGPLFYEVCAAGKKSGALRALCRPQASISVAPKPAFLSSPSQHLCRSQASISVVAKPASLSSRSQHLCRFQAGISVAPKPASLSLPSQHLFCSQGSISIAPKPAFVSSPSQPLCRPQAGISVVPKPAFLSSASQHLCRSRASRYLACRACPRLHFLDVATFSLVERVPGFIHLISQHARLSSTPQASFS